MEDQPRRSVSFLASEAWLKLKNNVSKTTLFLAQVCLIYIVVITSLYNLTKDNLNSQDGKFWIALLSSCIAYLLPNPSMSKTKDKHVSNTSQQ